MTKVSQHLKNTGYQISCTWPKACRVQWGAGGIVFSRSGNYRTAFFEAFPNDGAGGFIRGEGETIEAAEQSAFSQWKKQAQCDAQGGHAWSRTRRLKDGKTRTYSNGGCFCTKCGAFKTVMKPIVKLGEWRKPFSADQLASVAGGMTHPYRDDEDARRYARQLELRASLAGVDLPDWRQYRFPEQEAEFEELCLTKAAEYYATQTQLDTNKDGILAGLATEWGLADIKRRAEELGLIEPEEQV